jgi:hypothetical protein
MFHGDVPDRCGSNQRGERQDIFQNAISRLSLETRRSKCSRPQWFPACEAVFRQPANMSLIDPMQKHQALAFVIRCL